MTGSILIKGLSKSYGDFTLGSIDLELPEGYIIGIVGNNGAGKTTMIRCITGATIPDSGSVTIPDDLGGIGVVFDECHMPPTLTARDLSGILPGMFDSWNQERFESLLDDYRIDMDKKIKGYSRGMGMKPQVAIALSHDPGSLILDEPTAGLDPVARDEFLDTLLEYMQDEGNTVLMSSHITSDLEKIADYILFIHDGNVVLFEDKDSLMDNYGILRCGNLPDLRMAGNGHIMGIRENDFGASALIDDKKGIREAFPELVVDDATIDDIFVYMVRGDSE